MASSVRVFTKTSTLWLSSWSDGRSRGIIRQSELRSRSPTGGPAAVALVEQARVSGRALALTLGVSVT